MRLGRVMLQKWKNPPSARLDGLRQGWGMVMLIDWIRNLVSGRPRVESVEVAPPRWKPEGDWKVWMLAGQHGYPSPYDHKLIRMMREGWAKPYVGAPSDLAAAMNVTGLYWQPFDGDIIDGEWVPASPLQALSRPSV